MRPLVTGSFLFFSPNIIWLAIALTLYFLAPYNIQAARTLDNLDWVFNRFCSRMSTFAFCSDSASTLSSLLATMASGIAPLTYWAGQVARSIHNVVLDLQRYVKQNIHSSLDQNSSTGVPQHVLLPVGSDSVHSLGGNRPALLRHWSSSLPQQPGGGFKLLEQRLLLSLLLCRPTLPWSSLLLLSQVDSHVSEMNYTHAPRFIHIRALYKHIHAVHHRNTDIEPFAGLSMHPIEVLNILIVSVLHQYKLRRYWEINP